MSSPEHCPVCAGPLRLWMPGGVDELEPASLSPTCHATGAHGDLFACHECGSVHQAGLPETGELRELYRQMDDEAYLDQEAGRRATARRLLSLVGERAAGTRLLDVGCGHGLLLDEARRLGYEVEGLELSANAAAYAREVLGLSVREQALEEADLGEAFDVVVLADVLEHVEDPVAALDRCEALLRPGGVLCVVTPDPSSLTARFAGPRWWAYLPAHTCLLPRATLRELLAARGLVVSDDVPLVRSFELRYWLAGLAERGGPVASAARAAAGTALGRRSVSLSLGDERVMVAKKAEPIAAAEPLMEDRGGEPKVHVVLPAYNAATTVGRVAEAMPVDAADRALLVDDSSPDETSEEALRHGFEVLRTPARRGYGATQKTAYARAMNDGADIIVMVHADNQYDPALVDRMVKPIEAGIADVVIGSRLLEDEAIAGGMPRWKWVGNRFLTAIENAAFHRGYSEYHTGYRAFSSEFLRSVPFLRNSDDFVFDQEIFAQIVHRRARTLELPIPTRYFLEASTVSFKSSVAYGLRTLGVLARYRLDRRHGRWALLRRPAATPGRTGERSRL